MWTELPPKVKKTVENQKSSMKNTTLLRINHVNNDSDALERDDEYLFTIEHVIPYINWINIIKCLSPSSFYGPSSFGEVSRFLETIFSRANVS